MEIRLDKRLDPDGKKLCRLLEAHEVYKRLGALRSLLVPLLAFASAGLWVNAHWPTLLPHQLRESTLELWEVFFWLTLSTSIGEWMWYRRQLDSLRQYHEHPKET